jgi:ferredoxin
MLASARYCQFSLTRSFAAKISPAIDTSTNSLYLDRAKCVSCGLCVKACKTIAGQGILALVASEKGKKKIGTTSGLLL